MAVTSLGNYNYELPERLIAQEPAFPRDHAKLLVYNLKTSSVTDCMFYDIGEFLPDDTTVVVNNSKVENCRWLFGKDEIFVLEKSDPNTIRAMVRPGRKFKLNTTYSPCSWLTFTVTNIDNEGVRTLKLNVQHDDPRLKAYEHVPLPPYIAQDDKLAEEYQTVYAKPLGSLAAPTAGLHFTEELLDDIKKHQNVAELTLHVGLGTFAKIDDEDIKAKKLHQEHYQINAETADMLNRAKSITAVGTTTTRTLESALENEFTAKSGTTDIFIQPGYRFKAVDHMITNFHLPSTSLMMMIAAFIADKKQLKEDEAISELLRIYQHAIDGEYRFYSFGDGMLLV